MRTDIKPLYFDSHLHSKIELKIASHINIL